MFVNVLNHNDSQAVLNLPPRFLLVGTYLNIFSLSPGAPAFQFLQQSTARGSNPVSFYPAVVKRRFLILFLLISPPFSYAFFSGSD